MIFKDITELIKNNPELKGEILILAEQLSGITRAQLLAFPEREVPFPDRLSEAISQLKADRPLQYILGKWEFGGNSFFVGEGVLIPREDTLAVIELAKKRLSKTESVTFADLGSGSGCIAVTLACEPNFKGYAVEKSQDAAVFLRRNVKAHKDKITVIVGDMFEKQTLDKLKPLDLVISNPPYITKEQMKEISKSVLNEPHNALYGGEDGLDFYRKITKIYKQKLNHGGVIALEVGYTQADAVGEILLQNGFTDVQEMCDLSGIRRAVSAVKNV